MRIYALRGMSPREGSLRPPRFALPFPRSRPLAPLSNDGTSDQRPTPGRDEHAAIGRPSGRRQFIHP
jgi:hypothetical protein